MEADDDDDNVTAMTLPKIVPCPRAVRLRERGTGREREREREGGRESSYLSFRKPQSQSLSFFWNERVVYYFLPFFFSSRPSNERVEWSNNRSTDLLLASWLSGWEHYRKMCLFVRIGEGEKRSREFLQGIPCFMNFARFIHFS